jgi:hypothetical protein
MSDSLSPPNGERVGVRVQHLKTKRLPTLTHSSIGARPLDHWRDVKS